MGPSTSSTRIPSPASTPTEAPGRVLAGKVALITGASGGIGSAVARLFSEQGALLALHFSSNLPAVETRASAFRADLLDQRAPERLIKAVLRRFGRVDILVNNAGAIIGGDHFLELSRKNWEATLRLNAQAPFFLSREAFRAMQGSGGGRIINISSVGVKFGGSARSMHYAAAKAALETMTRCFAREGAPHGILVNAIRAGIIDTPMHDKARKNMDKRVALIPLKRMGHPEDVARMALHLAGPGGDFITGQILPVTGGE